MKRAFEEGISQDDDYRCYIPSPAEDYCSQSQDGLHTVVDEGLCVYCGFEPDYFDDSEQNSDV